MIITALPVMVFATETSTYVDTQNHWAEEAIDRWSEYSVVQGKGDGVFDPEGQMTRAEAAQVFANLLGLNKVADLSGFKDVKNAWYKTAIAKCYAAGILNGKGEGKMDPNGNITREEFMTMYARAICISQGKDAKEAKTELTQKGYTDTNKVSSWAADAVSVLVDKGFVKGVSETSLAPQNNIDRASVMALLNQSISTYVGKDSTETTVTAKSEGITLIANTAVTKVTGNADVVVVAAGAEKYNEETGKIEHNDIKVESAKMPIARVEGENITVTLTINTQADDAEVTITGVDSEIIIESTASAKNVTLSAEGSKATVAGKVETIKVEETAKEAVVDTKSTAKVETVENKAESTTVKGTGTVTEVKSSEDVKIETKNTKVENTNEEKQIAVTDSKGTETKVETKTESSSSGSSTSGTTVNKQETPSGGGGGYTPPAHTHTFEEKWTADATYHWHAATCVHTSEVSGKAEHTWGADELASTCAICGFDKDAVARIDSVYYKTFSAAYSSVGAVDTKQINLLSVDGFKQFRDAVNGGSSCAGITIALDIDIDLNNEKWTPIGTSPNAFSGVFDGQGYTVFNYQLKAVDSNGTGLFGKISGSPNESFNNSTDVWNNVTGEFKTDNITENKYTCVVKNLNVADVTVEYGGDNNEYSSPVVGYIISAYISDINVKGNTKITAKYGGGVVGYSSSNNVINNCIIDSSVQFSGGGNKAGHYGGIVAGAENYKTFVVENCTNNASIEASYGHIGGIAGNIANNSIIAYNCVNNGNIECTNVNNCGGIAGQSYGGWFIDCINNGKLSGSTKTSTKAGDQYAFGGIVGCGYNHDDYFYNCVNNGDIDVTGTPTAVGGIVGLAGGSVNTTNCKNNGTISWPNGTWYPINEKYANATLKDTAYDSMPDLQNAINDAISGTIGLSTLTLTNVTVGGAPGVLSIPDKVIRIISNSNVFNEIRFAEDQSVQNVSISVSGAGITINQDYSNKSVTFIGDNNNITVNGTLASFGISGNSTANVNADLSGSLSFNGTGMSKATISAGKTVHCVNFLGTGSYTVTNYGTITNKDGGGHVIYTQSPCTFTVNNYGTIENTKANATYALLFYGGCNATFNADADSTLSTEHAGLIAAYGSAGSVKFNYEEGAKINDAGSQREYTSIKWGTVEVEKVDDISNIGKQE